MKIVPYTQTLGESCLVVCFLILWRAFRKLEFTASLEQEIYFSGARRCKEYYVVGVIQEISQRFHPRIALYVDNRWFTKKLEEGLGDGNISFSCQRINLDLIDSILEKGEMPILYIDNYWLTKGYHAPHFVIVVEKRKKYALIDPWSGRKRYLSEEQLSRSIIDLRSHLKLCPLLIIFEAVSKKIKKLGDR